MVFDLCQWRTIFHLSLYYTNLETFFLFLLTRKLDLSSYKPFVHNKNVCSEYIENGFQVDSITETGNNRNRIEQE